MRSGMEVADSMHAGQSQRVCRILGDAGQFPSAK